MVPFLRPARPVYSRESSRPALTARANSGKLGGIDRRQRPARPGTAEKPAEESTMAQSSLHPKAGATFPARETRASLDRTRGSRAAVAVTVCAALALAAAPCALASNDRGTFSIVAFDSVTNELG